MTSTLARLETRSEARFQASVFDGTRQTKATIWLFKKPYILSFEDELEYNQALTKQTVLP